MKVLAQSKYGPYNYPPEMLDAVHKVITNNIFFWTRDRLDCDFKKKVWDELTKEFMSKYPMGEINDVEIPFNSSNMSPRYARWIAKAEEDNRLKPLFLHTENDFKSTQYFYDCLLYNVHYDNKTGKELDDVQSYILYLDLAPFVEKMCIRMEPIKGYEREWANAQGSPNVYGRLRTQINVVKDNTRMDIEQELDKIHEAVKTEFTKYLQYCIVPFDEDPNSHKFTPQGPVAFNSTKKDFYKLLSKCTESFLIGYKYFLKNLRLKRRRIGERTNYVDGITPEVVKTNVQLFNGEIFYGNLEHTTGFSRKYMSERELLLCRQHTPNDFMVGLRDNDPEAYEKAVKYMHRILTQKINKLIDEIGYRQGENFLD